LDAPFFDISLVDTDRVGPEQPLAVLVSKSPQRNVQVHSHFEQVSIAGYRNCVMSVAPDVRDRLERRRFMQLYNGQVDFYGIRPHARKEFEEAYEVALGKGAVDFVVGKAFGVLCI
jgi:hypothetical protein